MIILLGLATTRSITPLLNIKEESIISWIIRLIIAVTTTWAYIWMLSEFGSTILSHT